MSIVALPTAFSATSPAPRMPADAAIGFDGLLARFAQSDAGPAVAGGPAPFGIGPSVRPPIDAGRVSATMEALVAAVAETAPAPLLPPPALPISSATLAIAVPSNGADLAASSPLGERGAADRASAGTHADESSPRPEPAGPHRPEASSADPTLPVATGAPERFRDAAAPLTDQVTASPDGATPATSQPIQGARCADPASREANMSDAAPRPVTNREVSHLKHQGTHLQVPASADAAPALTPLQAGFTPYSRPSAPTIPPATEDEADAAAQPDVPTPSVRSARPRAGSTRPTGAQAAVMLDEGATAPVLPAFNLPDAATRSAVPAASPSPIVLSRGRDIAVPPTTSQGASDAAAETMPTRPSIGVADPSTSIPDASADNPAVAKAAADPLATAVSADQRPNESPAAQVAAPLQVLVRTLAQPELAGTATAAPSAGATSTPGEGSALRPASKSITIRLTPDHLGPVEIKVRLHGGSLDIAIRVVTPEALDSLAQDKHLLAAAVAAAGGRTGDLALTQAGPGWDATAQPGAASDRVRSDGGWSGASDGGAASNGNRNSSPFEIATDIDDDPPQAPPGPVSTRDGSLYL